MSIYKFVRTIVNGHATSGYHVLLGDTVLGEVFPTDFKAQPWIACGLGGQSDTLGSRQTREAAAGLVHTAFNDRADQAAEDAVLLDGPQEVTMTFRFVMDPTEAVDGPPPTAAQFRDAVDALAGVMLVQAEDGLYSLGYQDGFSDETENRYIASIAYPDDPTTVSTITVKDHRS